MTTRPADAPTETAPAGTATADASTRTPADPIPTGAAADPAPAGTATGRISADLTATAPTPAGTATDPASAGTAAPAGAASVEAAPLPEAADGADARATRRLRWLAFGGYFFLFGCLALVVVLVLGDALDGDGRGGPFTDAAFWAVPAGAAIGLVPLAAPRGLLPPVRRTVLVVAQYGAGVLAVLLQIADMV